VEGAPTGDFTPTLIGIFYATAAFGCGARTVNFGAARAGAGATLAG